MHLKKSENYSFNKTFKNLNIYKPKQTFHFTAGHVCLEMLTQGRSPLLSVKISFF